MDDEPPFLVDVVGTCAGAWLRFCPMVEPDQNGAGCLREMAVLPCSSGQN